MKIDLTDLGPVKKKMRVEVEAEDVQREAEAILRGYAAQARIPGFRRGKAPLALVRQRFGRELEEDVRERVVSTAFARAAAEKGLKPLGGPLLEDVVYEAGKPLLFSTTFEVLPVFEPRGYKGVEISRPAARIADEDVERMVEELRRSRARLVSEEGRMSAAGDIVYVDAEGEPEGGERFTRERLPVELGAPENLAAFNEKLVGVAAGQALEFEVDYPAEYGAKHLAGKRVAYRLLVREVKRPVLPDLDDEFAKDVGDFSGLEALRAKLRTDLEARLAREDHLQARQVVLDKVLLENPIVLPDGLVEQEIHHRLEEFARTLILQGVDPQQAKIDWDELRRRHETAARRSVHARILLDAIAATERLEVSDAEIDERVRDEAARLGESAAKLRASLEHGSRKESVRSQMLREKSLDYLTSVANIHHADRGESK